LYSSPNIVRVIK